MRPGDFTGPATPLVAADYAAAAAQLGVTIPAIRAVDEVESGGRGFHPDTHRPIILFEPHVFSRETNNRFDKQEPGVSYKLPRTRPYPKSQDERYAQLCLAATLDQKAALRSASWGRFQIMGFNHVACGFPTVQAFVAAMVESEARHLQAFCRFITNDRRKVAALRALDWGRFAELYNGPDYARNAYDQKLKAAHARHAAVPA